MKLVKDPTSDNPYLRLGFASRKDYLRSLSQEYSVSMRQVTLAAELLGAEEDFDALVSTLQDMSEY